GWAPAIVHGHLPRAPARRLPADAARHDDLPVPTAVRGRVANGLVRPVNRWGDAVLEGDAAVGQGLEALLLCRREVPDELRLVGTREQGKDEPLAAVDGCAGRDRDGAGEELAGVRWRLRVDEDAGRGRRPGLRNSSRPG